MNQILNFDQLQQVALMLRYPLLRNYIKGSFNEKKQDEFLDFLFALESESTSSSH